MASRQDVILLDGAMGTALRQRGVAVPDHRTSIWSALALTTAPDAVVQLHRDYIRAGANVITINNYARYARIVDESAHGGAARRADDHSVPAREEGAGG